MKNDIITFPYEEQRPLPEAFAGQDVRFSEGFCRHCIARYSEVGKVVFDPFAGFGTTLLTAQSMGRIGIGVEYLSERVDYIKTILQAPSQILQGDAREIVSMDLPQIDLCLCSPPYMNCHDHPEYPFDGYQVSGKGYSDYLLELEHIFTQVKARLKPNGWVLIEVSNIWHEGHFTPLVFDVATVLSKLFSFEGEWILKHLDTSGHPIDCFGSPYSYCLRFQNK